ncbi:MAG TPA: radical SAM protein, partial [Hellea balneolensis]|nr:radical SAM protein [Hellea balneolensis]
TYLLSDIMQTKRAELPKMQASQTHTRSRAIVQVQNGCNHRCTFCIIPYGRGNSRSVDQDAIIGQIRELVAGGIHEVVLSGVDISSWGEDLAGTPKLGTLVKSVLECVPDLARLRLSSIDLAEVDDVLMQTIANNPRFMPYLHLSLQHGDDLMLKRMKRRHLRNDAISLCRQLRELRPDIRFGADLIAGFPTESEQAFVNSLSLIKACDLTWLHVFPFSPKQGTPAARMPALDPALVKARAATLREAGNAARIRHLKRRATAIGKYDLALIERGSRGQPGLGRLADFSPIDLGPHNLVPGTLQPVHITGYTEQTLLGELA